MSAPVLFDIPGPKARARIRIGTAIGSLLILGLLAVVLIRLAANGQLERAPRVRARQPLPALERRDWAQ